MVEFDLKSDSALVSGSNTNSNSEANADALSDAVSEASLNENSEVVSEENSEVASDANSARNTILKASSETNSAKDASADLSLDDPTSNTPANIDTKVPASRLTDIKLNVLTKPIHPDYRLCCAGLTCRGLKHQQQSKANQDALYVTPLAAGALMVLGDGVGSCVHAALGAQNLGSAIQQICEPLTQSQAMPLFEEVEPSLSSLEDLDIPAFLQKAHAAWCAQLQAKGLKITDCKTTCQILWAYKQHLLVAQLGDGVIGVITSPDTPTGQIWNFDPALNQAPSTQDSATLGPDTLAPNAGQEMQSYTLAQPEAWQIKLFVQPEQAFVNETFAWGKNAQLKHWQYQIFPLSQVQGVLSCTDGIASALEETSLASFIKQLIQDLSPFSPKDAAKQLKGLLIRWPDEFCEDDQTLLVIYPYVPKTRRKRPPEDRLDDLEAVATEEIFELKPYYALAAKHRSDTA